MPTDAARALGRIRNGDFGLQGYKQVLYQIQGLVMGDLDAMKPGYAGGGGINADNYVKAKRPFRADTPDRLIQQIEDGQNNDLLNHLRAVCTGNTFQFPAIELSGVIDEIQVVNAEWLKKRMGPHLRGGCDFLPDAKASLMDYLVGGLGFLNVFVDSQGRPGARYVNTLDMVWDQATNFPSKMRWVGITDFKPLWELMEMYPDSAVLKDAALRGPDGRYAKMDAALDRPVEFVSYFDRETKSGTQVVFLKTGDRAYVDEPVFHDENGYRIDIDGDEEPFIPTSCKEFLTLPGRRFPMGMAEAGLPAQIYKRRLMKRVNRNLDRLQDFYLYNEKMFAEGIEEFMSAAQQGAVPITGDLEQAIKLVSASPVEQWIFEEMQRMDGSLQRDTGVGPVQSNTRLPDAKTKVMANLIAQQGGLLNATTTATNARSLEEVFTMVLACGKMYDKNSFTCDITDKKSGLRIKNQFGPKTVRGTVQDYLRPDCDLDVSEDSMKAPDRMQRIQNALMDVKLSATPLDSNRAKAAYREAMEALNRTDIEWRMSDAQAPAMAPGMAGAPGMAPAMPVTTAGG